MKLRRLNELELIAAIREEFQAKERGLVLGVGDDAAVLKAGRRYLLVTKDLLVEETHFRLPFQTAYQLGRKSLAVNLSDIAAMGGRPLYSLLGLGLPGSLKPSWVEDFISGFRSLAEEEKVALIGGDLSRAKRITISVTVIGETKHFIGRHGARPGDSLWVSGYLGLAAAGLHLLESRGKKRGGEGNEKKKKGQEKEGESVFLEAFLNPKPQLELGQWLSRRKLATALIDTSDGLSADLYHLCEASRVGAEVILSRVPVHPHLKAYFPNPWPFVFNGGEDYQLLFTVNPNDGEKVRRVSRRFGLSEIGQIVEKRGVWKIDHGGRRQKLERGGFQHFKP